MKQLPIDIAALRQSYVSQPLTEDQVSQDPVEQYRQWFAQALEVGITEPNAMTLATVTAGGTPAARIVLLKGVEAGGFVFYTNYDSHKGEELAVNPNAALVFWWESLFRQVRIEGKVEKVSSRVSEAYFQSRPKGSQIGAWASPQSRTIPGREFLDARVESLEKQYAGEEVLPLPENWGGYFVRPVMIEFWQGQTNRLHDRLRYSRLPEGDWKLERLAP